MDELAKAVELHNELVKLNESKDDKLDSLDTLQELKD